jgi:hypothetical protein
MTKNIQCSIETHIIKIYSFFYETESTFKRSSILLNIERWVLFIEHFLLYNQSKSPTKVTIHFTHHPHFP